MGTQYKTGRRKGRHAYNMTNMIYERNREMIEQYEACSTQARYGVAHTLNQSVLRQNTH